MRLLKIFAILAGVLSLSLAAQESPDGGAKPAAVEELSQEELDAEMSRIEKAIEDTGDIEEFVPQKPLAADLPVALPSDI